MSNPWEEINLDDYENHMKLDSVMQLQAMNTIMKMQFYKYPARKVMILGIAGGNGLEHINPQIIETVYGVDINSTYLEECVKRYPKLRGTLIPLCVNLVNDKVMLPHADLVVANLLIEYIGYDCFQKVIEQVRPSYVSCVIQINTDNNFISDSPYVHVFDCLDSVHHQIDARHLIKIMDCINYNLIMHENKLLPNGKKLVRLDFQSI